MLIKIEGTSCQNELEVSKISTEKEVFKSLCEMPK